VTEFNFCICYSHLHPTFPPPPAFSTACDSFRNLPLRAQLSHSKFQVYVNEKTSKIFSIQFVIVPSLCKLISYPVVFRLRITMSTDSLPTNKVSTHFVICSSSSSRPQPAAAVKERGAEALQAHVCETYVSEGARPSSLPPAPEPPSAAPLHSPPFECRQTLSVDSVKPLSSAATVATCSSPLSSSKGQPMSLSLAQVRSLCKLRRCTGSA
jgi:hypothetical protein